MANEVFACCKRESEPIITTVTLQLIGYNADKTIDRFNMWFLGRPDFFGGVAVINKKKDEPCSTSAPESKQS